MRLLHTSKIQLVEVYGEQIPPYAILSHTWSHEECTLQDLQELSRNHSDWADDHVASIAGFDKIRKSAAVAQRENIQYIWIDTCCIDKTSSAELSEAINSMYRWYDKAQICYAYLCDVEPVGTEDIFGNDSSFRLSRWFTRGWTLQELIAARDVRFYARDWSFLGSKQQSDGFTDLLNSITGVHREVLSGALLPSDISIASRMRWAAFRKTTRVEDMAYCLLGIFDVNIPLLYGEGESAFIRLQEAILLKDDDQSLFAWHSNEQGDGGDDDDQGPPALLSTNRMCGLLAQSPDQFWEAGDINYAMPLNFLGTPSAVTSKGLRVDLHLRECRNLVGADYSVTLSCEKVVDGRRVAPVIYLRRLWGQGDQFARVFAGRRTFEGPVPLTEIGMDDQGFYETVFVRQKPSSGLPLIRISVSKEPFPSMPANSETMQWSIKDVHPKGVWNERSQCLETRDFLLGKAIGIFRVAIGGGEGDPVMDLAVGMNIINQRSCRSWCHLMNPHSQTIERTFYEVNRGRREVPDIKYQAVSSAPMPFGTQRFPTDVDVTAAVSEGYGQRSLALPISAGTDDPSSGQEAMAIDLKWLAGAKFIVEASEGPVTPITSASLENYNAAGSISNALQSQLGKLLATITITDSLEVSVFQRAAVGKKVRSVTSFQRTKIGTPIKALPEYCRSAMLSVEDDSWRLALACFYGQETEIARMMEGGSFDEDGPDSFLQLRPMHWAVLGGHLSAVSSLTRNKKAARWDSPRRLAPMHLAALMGQSEILRELIIAAGDATTPSSDQVPTGTVKLQDLPTHFAAAYATDPNFWNEIRLSSPLHQYLATEFMHNALGETPLHRAAAMGNVAATRYLLRYCMRDSFSSSVKVINALDNCGRTPLWHAACANSQEIVKLLLQAGAFANLAGDEGLSPIHVACREDQAESLAALLEGGANPNLLTADIPLLPTQIACIFGHAYCLEVLLDHGADTISSVSVPDAGTMSFNALHLAIAN
ncbi:hypothetical protein B0T24DRAFT_500499, partial [Lasiosphaeria ovina]